MRRAAAWDGAFPIDGTAGPSSMMPPGMMAEAIAFVSDHRTATGPFDVVHAGLLTGDPAVDRRLVQQYADVGVTWWLEHVYPGRMPITDLRGLIRRGPPQVD
jgi:hypothetical protein